MNKFFLWSVTNVKQAVIATSLSLTLVTGLIVSIAMPFGYELVWNALFEVAMEQSEQQAEKFSNFAIKDIENGSKPESVVSKFQQILGTSSFDPGQFVCIVDKNGKILAHPDSTSIGSKVNAKYLFHNGKQTAGQLMVSNSPLASNSVVEFTRSKKIHLLYQKPLLNMDSSVWIHTDSEIIQEKADRVLMALSAVILPTLLLIIIIGTLAVRRVGSSYETRLENLAQTDGLTGLSNRRSFDESLNYEWNRAIRSQGSVSLIMMDIDHFKLYNDNYGHQAGDEVLQAVSKYLKSTIRRANDIVARYGGEEFAIILADYSKEQAVELAKNLVMGIEDLQIKHEFSSCSGYVTSSMGVTTMQPDKLHSIKKFIRMADKLLYDAKENGRNQVRFN